MVWCDVIWYSMVLYGKVWYGMVWYGMVWYDIYLLLAECEVRTASYGPSFFLSFMAQARSARAMKTRKDKTRIHNLPYGPSKRGQ